MHEAYEPGLVSVIVPTYNRAELVSQAMDSVFTQKFRPIELLLVDDGSTDETRSVISHWQRQHSHDKRFNVRLLHQANAGAASARNRGLIESQGEFIQFLDSDDLLLPEKLEHMVPLLQNEIYDFAYCITQVTNGANEFKLGHTFGKPCPDTLLESLFELHWHTTGPLYRRSTCLTLGPQAEDLLIWEDWEYDARTKALGMRGLFTPFVGSLLRVHGGPQLGTKRRGEEALPHIRSAENAVDRVRNTVTLCLSKEQQTKAGTRLAKRYAVVAFQYGKEGFVHEMAECLDKATACGGIRFACLARAMKLLPYRVASSWAFQLVRIRNRLKSTIMKLKGLGRPA